MSDNDFWRSLFNSFAPKTQGQGWGPDARGLPPLEALRSPYERTTEQIRSVTSNRDTPFRVIDINPYSLDKSTFGCQVDPNVLKELVGIEELGGGNIIGNNQLDESSRNPYWRTIEIPYAGNFVKIEYLPARIVDESTPVTASGSALNPSESLIDQTGLSWDKSGNFNPALSSTNMLLQHQHQSKKMILVQFDNIKNQPLIANHGTCFDVEFGSIFITVKTGNPRIRVTVGFNSRITNPSQDLILNADLAKGPGFGLWTNPILHCCPWVWSTGDAGSTRSNGNISIGATSTTTVPIFNQANTNQFNPRDGIGLGWITGIHLYVQSGTTNSEVVNKTTIYTSTNGSSGGVHKILWRNQDRYPNQKTASTTVDNTTKSQSFNFPIPIRFSLRDGWTLTADLSNLGSSSLTISMEVWGYTYGRNRSITDAGTNVCCQCLDKVNEHPFFLDNYDDSSVSPT